MKQVKTAPAHTLFTQPVEHERFELIAEDYQLRLALLCARMEEEQIDSVVIYGDREHFSHIEYFSSYDCRFEEALLVVHTDGRVAILVGNEGLAYSEQIPYPVQRLMYQNFSLPGQPRESLRPLKDFLADAGIRPGSRLGIVGVKYMADDTEGDPATTYDVPAYIFTALNAISDGNHINFTPQLIGYPNGIRTRLHSAREIAWAEDAGNRVANVVQRMLAALAPGKSELEVSVEGMAAMEAINVFPMVNFGARSVALGLKSPLPNARLALGEVCAVCYSLRGNLTSKIAVAANSIEDYAPALRPYYESFYQQHFRAMCAWYESVRVGAKCADAYAAVYSHISHEEHGITLNPGHTAGTEEWLNSAFTKDSTHTLQSGELLQVDIIASGADPVRTSICEDAVVIADAALREKLRAEYPAVYERVCQRQKVMREVLGIAISDDVLPMSNLNGVFYPFMLNREVVLAQG